MPFRSYALLGKYTPGRCFECTNYPDLASVWFQSDSTDIRAHGMDIRFPYSGEMTMVEYARPICELSRSTESCS